MPIAKVVVDLSLDREFDYTVPDSLRDAVKLGSRVSVPFGKRFVLGYVVGFEEQSKFPKLKPIESVVGNKAFIQGRVLELARWIAEYYCCPVEQAVRAALPEVVQKAKISWKERMFVRLTDAGAKADLEKIRKRAPKQAEILEALRKVEDASRVFAKRQDAASTVGGMFAAELLKHDRGSHATLTAMEKKGWVTLGAQTQERDPFRDENIVPSAPLALTADQQKALALCIQSIDTLNPPVVLIHGVTGSGKTEIYLQAIAHALSKGKGAIVLVPEIALTPQTVERFRARFSTGAQCEKVGVAVLHSNLSDGERHDEWHKIAEGRARIVIGPRSAVFAPVQNLGLIVVDEEHETTYKQDESPRYNARDVAVVRGKMEGAAVVLGSATPSLESLYNAHTKKYALARLPQRVDHKVMPVVRIVDMRQEAFRAKGVQIFSQTLKEAIARRLEKGEQVILFLNRRGYATHMLCTKCGYVAKCPHCSVSMTYHRPKERLLCHICGQSAPAPRVCPNETCRDPAIRYTGLGTQKVEETLQKLFPKSVIARMDSDTMTRKELYRKTLDSFRAGKTQILVGTQMIAKGLHFPNVTLVGIIYADMALHMQDFRAAERTFDLLVQVSGRAGRGDVSGEVIVQTYTPHHAAIQYARKHDVEGFYDDEIRWREAKGYPPLTHLICVTFRSNSEQKSAFFAQAVCRMLQQKVRAASPQAIVGEATPAPLARMKGQFRHQIILRGPRVRALSACVREVVESVQLPDDVNVTIDVDPMWLM
jgi:primosomal protein N' (replication factor Y)